MAKRILRKSLPETTSLYQPAWSIKRGYKGAWVVWWKSPERTADGFKFWRTHGKGIAPSTANEEQARNLAAAFIAKLRIPMLPMLKEEVEAEAAERGSKEKKLATLAERATQLRREAAERKRCEPQVPEVGMEPIIFDPAATYLMDCSKRVVQDYVLAHRSKAANLRRTITELTTSSIICEAELMLAQWFTRNRENIVAAALRATIGHEVPNVKETTAFKIMDEIAGLLGPAPQRKRGKSK